VTGGVAFLLVAVVCSIVGSVILWFGSRQPSSMEHHVEEFSREMQALSPDEVRPPRRTTLPRSHPDADRR
jgi:hypothetical protein